MNKFSYKVTIRKDRQLTTGEYPLCVLLIYCRKNRRLSLNISTSLKNWNGNQQIIKAGDPDHERKNKLITIYKNRVAEYETECIIKNKPVILDEAIRLLNGKSYYNKQSFYAYVDKEWKHYEATLKPNTLKKYRSHLNILKSYRKSLNFQEIDNDFLKGYEIYLHTKHSNCKNTIAKALKWIKSTINQAINDGIIDTTPFSRYKISSEPSNREYLTIREVERLEKLYKSNVLYPNMQETLRAFLFCCFTGLRLSDMKKLAYSEIREGIIFSVMHKTQIIVPIPLISRAKLLIDKKNTGNVFSTVSDQMLNKHLVKIAKIANIGKKITFHCSRHSFATISLDLGITQNTIQKVLGHTNVKTTEIYTHYSINLLKKEMNRWEKKNS